jgi:phospholipid/cholesterol/gamma-HCH transport system substrate-binding protein
METRANYALIGLFTLAVFAGILGFVYWFAAARNTGAKTSYRVVFSGSVSGLSRGSLVRFNGLRVGEVMTLDLEPEDPSRVLAVIDVDQRTPVKTDTRARLEYSGLTGQASVQLSGGTASAPALTAPDGGRPVIYADRSDFQDILETVQRLATRTDGILAKVEKVVDDNSGSIGGTIRSVETFARALADNSAGVGAFLSAVGDTAQRISALSSRLETLSATAEELLRNVDGSSVGRTVANVERFTQGLAENRRNIDAILTDGVALTRQLTEASQRLDGILAQADRVARAVDGEKIGRAIDNLDRIAQVAGNNAGEVDRVIKNVDALVRSVDPARIDRSIANVEGFTQALADNRANIDGILADGAALAKRLTASSQRLDEALAEITRIAQAVDGQRISRSLENVDRFTQALGNNSAEVDRVLKNAADISATLRSASGRVEEVLVAAQRFLGSASDGDSKGAFGEIAAAARSVRELADDIKGRTGSFSDAAKSFDRLAKSLEARAKEITAGLNRLTSSGGRDIEALAADARRAANEINRTVRNLGNDPSQILRGGRSSIPEYSGAR